MPLDMNKEAHTFDGGVDGAGVFRLLPTTSTDIGAACFFLAGDFFLLAAGFFFFGVDFVLAGALGAVDVFVAVSVDGPSSLISEGGGGGLLLFVGELTCC